MVTKSENGRDEAAIRGIINDRVRAIRDRDLDGVTAHHAPDVLTFDLLDPLRYAGTETVRERVEAWFSSYVGPIGYDIRDLDITAGEEVTFCHYLYHVSGTLKTGAGVSMWCRATSCLRNLDGVWRITHEHQSVPFDPETGQASLNLEP